jgi:hypothetical protein
MTWMSTVCVTQKAQITRTTESSQIQNSIRDLIACAEIGVIVVTFTTAVVAAAIHHQLPTQMRGNGCLSLRQHAPPHSVSPRSASNNALGVV